MLFKEIPECKDPLVDVLIRAAMNTRAPYCNSMMNISFLGLYLGSTSLGLTRKTDGQLTWTLRKATPSAVDGNHRFPNATAPFSASHERALQVLRADARPFPARPQLPGGDARPESETGSSDGFKLNSVLEKVRRQEL